MSHTIEDGIKHSEFNFLENNVELFKIDNGEYNISINSTRSSGSEHFRGMVYGISSIYRSRFFGK